MSKLAAACAVLAVMAAEPLMAQSRSDSAAVVIEGLRAVSAQLPAVSMLVSEAGGLSISATAAALKADTGSLRSVLKCTAGPSTCRWTRNVAVLRAFPPEIRGDSASIEVVSVSPSGYPHAPAMGRTFLVQLSRSGGKWIAERPKVTEGT